MIKTKDKRKFFTHRENLSEIMEFSKMFRAEISTVQVNEAEVLDLEELAPAFCDANYKGQAAKIKVLQIMYPTRRRRRDILKNSAQIRKYIRSKLERKGQISLEELKDRFKGKGLTTACFCNHLRFMKAEVVEMGKELVKVGIGTYKIEEKNGDVLDTTETGRDQGDGTPDTGSGQEVGGEGIAQGSGR